MIILYILLFILTFLWLMGIVCVVTKHKIFGKLFHDKLGWCYPDETIIDDNICKFCGKHIQQDSQGNWY